MQRTAGHVAATVLDRYGTTFAEDAGIELRDEPAPLFQLLVLAELLSARIGAPIAAATAGELWHAGWATPQRMRDASRPRVIAALGRGGYRRYDERTATQLRDMAALVLDRCLRNGRSMAHFQRLLAKANAIPWTLSTSADFRWPTTVGGTPDRLTRLMHRYMDYVQDIAAEQVGVLKTFQEVLHMVAPPSALFRPAILGRVIARAALPGRPKPAPTPRSKAAAT